MLHKRSIDFLSLIILHSGCEQDVAAWTEVAGFALQNSLEKVLEQVLLGFLLCHL